MGERGSAIRDIFGDREVGERRLEEKREEDFRGRDWGSGEVFQERVRERGFGVEL